MELCVGRAGAGCGDTRTAEDGRRAGAGREDDGPQVVLDRARSLLRVAARRASAETGGRRSAASETSSSGPLRMDREEEEATGGRKWEFCRNGLHPNEFVHLVETSLRNESNIL